VQRDIANIVGMSIGMTNTIVKRLAKKGLLTVRRINSRNIRYALSPKGMRVLSDKSYSYFKRTLKIVARYKEQIGNAVNAAAETGYDTVILVGESELDFIVEHFCSTYGLGFRRVKGGSEAAEDAACASEVLGPGEYPVFSENVDPENGWNTVAFYLRTIIW
jgi:DNA-binding PadR family transcriptional regulator